MFGLDALTGGGALGMIPGANVFSLVTKGLEMIKDLIDQGNTKGADAVLGFLNNVLNESAMKDAGGAADPQPFTPPQQQTSGAPLNLEFTYTAPASKMVSHGGLPTVDGSAAGDRMLTEAARGLVEGSPASKERALKAGSREWMAVTWAMQQHEKIQYNADTSRFFTQLSDGSKLDICSIHDIEDVIENGGGFDRSSPTAAAAVGEYLKEKVDGAYRLPMTATLTLSIIHANRPPETSGDTGNLDVINSQIDELKRKLQEFEAARQLMAQSTTNVTMTVGR